jgi:adenylate kinase
MNSILVTGTPATGKTMVAKTLAESLGCKYVDVKRVIREHKLEGSYDEKRHCGVVDEEKLRKILENMISESKTCLIIDSHLSHFVSKEKARLCIVTKCDLKELEKRLKARGYDEAKVKDNLECEIMQVCESEAFELGHDMIIVDTTSGFDVEEIKEKIREKK